MYLTNGIGTINIPNLNADNYTFNVIFNGTENYDKSVSTVNFEVKPQSTSITSKNANYVINYDNIYSVTVNPQVSNVNITLFPSRTREIRNGLGFSTLL